MWFQVPFFCPCSEVMQTKSEQMTGSSSLNNHTLFSCNKALTNTPTWNIWLHQSCNVEEGCMTVNKWGGGGRAAKPTFLIHQPHEQEPGGEAQGAPQHQQSDVRLGEAVRVQGRVLDGTPEVPDHALHEAQQGEQAQHRPAPRVHAPAHGLGVRGPIRGRQ